MRLNIQTPVLESRLVSQAAEGKWLGIAVSHLTERDRAWDTNACLYRQGLEELSLHFPCQELSVLNKDQSKSKICWRAFCVSVHVILKIESLAFSVIFKETCRLNLVGRSLLVWGFNRKLAQSNAEVGYES